MTPAQQNRAQLRIRGLAQPALSYVENGQAPAQRVRLRLHNILPIKMKGHDG